METELVIFSDRRIAQMELRYFFDNNKNSGWDINLSQRTAKNGDKTIFFRGRREVDPYFYRGRHFQKITGIEYLSPEYQEDIKRRIINKD